MNRMRVLNHLYENKIDNAIILSGDSHANWVSDLARKCKNRDFKIMFLLRLSYRP